MNRLIVPVAVLFLGVAQSLVWGQQPLARPTHGASITVPESTTPEMWFYREEMRRHDDPQMAVRRNAEARAEQRMQRIAALKWYGYSNSRPVVNATPWGSTYSAHWISNTTNPWGWSTARRPVLIYTGGQTYRR